MHEMSFCDFASFSQSGLSGTAASRSSKAYRDGKAALTLLDLLCSPGQVICNAAVSCHLQSRPRLSQEADALEVFFLTCSFSGESREVHDFRRSLASGQQPELAAAAREQRGARSWYQIRSLSSTFTSCDVKYICPHPSAWSFTLLLLLLLNYGCCYCCCCCFLSSLSYCLCYFPFRLLLLLLLLPLTAQHDYQFSLTIAAAAATTATTAATTTASATPPAAASACLVSATTAMLPPLVTSVTGWYQGCLRYSAEAAWSKSLKSTTQVATRRRLLIAHLQAPLG